jgi:uncharacterized membrane protein YhaH (DUF805 family)
VIRPRDIVRGQGTVNRPTFLFAGLALGILKQILDVTMGVVAFHGGWNAFNYWLPLGRLVGLGALTVGELAHLLAYVALAVPFIWIGVCLTLARLRDAALPLWMSLFFFLPFLNLAFFVYLCCVPTAGAGAELRGGPRPGRSVRWDRWIPRSAAGSAFAGVMLTLPIGLLLVLFSTHFLTLYGWGLFVGIPFMMGFFSVMVYCWHEPRSFAACLGVACLSPLLLGIGLLFYAIEGLICLLMAAPIAMVLALMGGAFAYWLQSSRHAPAATPAVMGLLLVGLPLGMAAEHWAAPNPPVFAVTTSVEVNAPPEVVWPNVIAFTELPAPDEFLFRIGIAYPQRAEIAGTGPGAVRQCLFSTGAFTEPIEVWDAPRLLKFSVSSNPPPLEEWTPYKAVTPPHLRGFLVSQGGQFRLIPLPGGRTLLEGTTWYRHSMWPAAYWKLWSDHIIHTIHLRVLRYIAARSVASL